jgi:murein peptide amidase A
VTRMSWAALLALAGAPLPGPGGDLPGLARQLRRLHKGVPVVTIELPNAQRTPLDAEMRQMWVDLLRWTAAKVAGDGPSLR